MINLENDLEKILNFKQTPEQFEFWYMDIVNNAKVRGLNKTVLNYYTEKHHIVPNCLGGKDNDDNYVLLTALEHITVHILLCYRYPHSPELTYAAWRMINPAKKNINADGKIRIEKEIKLRLFALNKIDIVTISKIKELHIKNISKPIVGYSDDLEILRIYSSSSCAEIDGIDRTTIQKAARFSIKSFGINWDYLDNFEINHQDKIDKFNLDRELGKELPKLEIDKENYLKSCRLESIKKAINARTNIKPIVGYNFDTKDIKIYKTVTETKKDGFTNTTISSLLKNNKCNSTHKNLYWMYLDEFSKRYPRIIENLNKNKEKGIIPEIKHRDFMKKSSTIVIKYSTNSKIEKIYKSLKQAERDGFGHKGINRSINTDTEYKGFHWARLVDWKDIDKLEEYYRDHPEDREKYE